MSNNNQIKVVWLCVQPLNIVANEYGYKDFVFGGWLDGISSLLRSKSNIKFTYIFPNKVTTGIKMIEKDGIEFIGIGIDKSYLNNFIRVINEIKPDVVHVFGTENKNINYLLLNSDLDCSIISIQGVMDIISKKYYSEVNKYYIFNFISNIPFWLVLTLNKLRYVKLAKSEKKVLQKVKNAIGRTDFDSNFISLFKNIRYYQNNEILRSEFYSASKWKTEDVKQFQIYVSQGNYPIKGFHILLKAISILKNEFPNIKVIVAGENILDGYGIAYKLGFSYGNFIEYIIKKDNLEDNVTFVGFKKPTEVIDLLLQSHVFVIPSSIENSPNSLGEAMLLGVPSVCSNVGGIPSMVEDRHSSLLYEFSDAYDLAKNLKEIFKDNSLANKLSQNSQLKANQIFDKEMNTNELIKIYQYIKADISSFRDSN